MTAALRPQADEISFFGVKQQAERLRANIDRRIKTVLDHGAYIGGPEIAELEMALKSRTGAAACVACSSGTDAIVIPLMAEGLTARDAVFIPAFTYNATANAVIMAGGTPVFVDVARETFNIDIAALEAEIARVVKEGRLRPRAIIAVDLFGLPADYAALRRIAGKHGMLLIADAAQSFGGAAHGTAVGALADVSTTSFYPTKTLGGYGDGGAIFSMDPARAKIWESIRWHGTDEARKDSVRVGMNGRLDSLQAAVLLAKLEVFDEEWASRERLARIYAERLGNRVPMAMPPKGVKHAWGLFSVLAEDRDGVREALAKRGVPTAIYYAKPLHHHGAFKAYAPAGGLANSEYLCARIFSLPFHPYMTEGQAVRAAEALLEVT